MEKAIRHLPASFDQIAAKLAGSPVPRVRKIVSLFSGCGGMDLGFLGGFRFADRIYDRLPFEIIWANDINTAACDTYRSNLQHDIHCGDIWDVMESLPKKADVVIGGFPCQDVSVNGNQLAVNGTRSTLYKAMAEVVNRLQPRIFVAENVKGLLMTHSKEFYDDLQRTFEDIGYSVSTELYLAADYGVPQMRERVFIVGVKGKKPFQHPTRQKNQAKWVSAQDVLGDLEYLPRDESINHIWSQAAVSPEQGNRCLKADSPATTIRAECHGNSPFHYKLDRRISMREAARIQSFPDDFIFKSKLRQTERQIGNAVPPVLAWYMAKAVQSYLA